MLTICARVATPNFDSHVARGWLGIQTTNTFSQKWRLLRVLFLLNYPPTATQIGAKFAAAGLDLPFARAFSTNRRRERVPANSAPTAISPTRYRPAAVLGKRVLRSFPHARRTYVLIEEEVSAVRYIPPARRHCLPCHKSRHWKGARGEGGGGGQERGKGIDLSFPGPAERDCLTSLFRCLWIYHEPVPLTASFTKSPGDAMQQ